MFMPQLVFEHGQCALILTSKLLQVHGFFASKLELSLWIGVSIGRQVSLARADFRTLHHSEKVHSCQDHGLVLHLIHPTILKARSNFQLFKECTGLTM